MGYPQSQFLGRDIGGKPVYQDPIWEDNEPFTAELIFDGYGRGRSSAVFYWISDQNRRYQMFMTDMTDLLKSVDIVGGKVASRKWIIRKRGQNYGIALYVV